MYEKRGWKIVYIMTLNLVWKSAFVNFGFRFEFFYWGMTGGNSMSDAQPLSLIQINCKNLFNKIQFIEPLDFLRAKNSIISFVNLVKKPVQATALKKFMLSKDIANNCRYSLFCGWSLWRPKTSISFDNLV